MTTALEVLTLPIPAETISIEDPCSKSVSIKKLHRSDGSDFTQQLYTEFLRSNQEDKNNCPVTVEEINKADKETTNKFITYCKTRKLKVNELDHLQEPARSYALLTYLKEYNKEKKESRFFSKQLRIKDVYTIISKIDFKEVEKQDIGRYITADEWFELYISSAPKDRVKLPEQIVSIIYKYALKIKQTNRQESLQDMELFSTASGVIKFIEDNNLEIKELDNLKLKSFQLIKTIKTKAKKFKKLQDDLCKNYREYRLIIAQINFKFIHLPDVVNEAENKIDTSGIRDIARYEPKAIDLSKLEAECISEEIDRYREFIREANTKDIDLTAKITAAKDQLEKHVENKKSLLEYKDEVDAKIQKREKLLQSRITSINDMITYFQKKSERVEKEIRDSGIEEQISKLPPALQSNMSESDGSDMQGLIKKCEDLEKEKENYKKRSEDLDEISQKCEQELKESNKEIEEDISELCTQGSVAEEKLENLKKKYEALESNGKIKKLKADIEKMLQKNLAAEAELKELEKQNEDLISNKAIKADIEQQLEKNFAEKNRLQNLMQKCDELIASVSDGQRLLRNETFAFPSGLSPDYQHPNMTNLVNRQNLLKECKARDEKKLAQVCQDIKCIDQKIECLLQAINDLEQETEVLNREAETKFLDKEIACVRQEIRRLYHEQTLPDNDNKNAEIVSESVENSKKLAEETDNQTSIDSANEDSKSIREQVIATIKQMQKNTLIAYHKSSLFGKWRFRNFRYEDKEVDEAICKLNSRSYFRKVVDRWFASKENNRLGECLTAFACSLTKLQANTTEENLQFSEELELLANNSAIAACQKSEQIESLIALTEQPASICESYPQIKSNICKASVSEKEQEFASVIKTFADKLTEFLRKKAKAESSAGSTTPKKEKSEEDICKTAQQLITLLENMQIMESELDANFVNSQYKQLGEKMFYFGGRNNNENDLLKAYSLSGGLLSQITGREYDSNKIVTINDKLKFLCQYLKKDNKIGDTSEAKSKSTQSKLASSSHKKRASHSSLSPQEVNSQAARWLSDEKKSCCYTF